MSTNDPMTQEQLDAIRERVDTATDGPWAPWLDQDGKPHMHGRLMVGVAAGVIPDGETWVEGPDVNNPVAETYTPEDRTFISHAREDVPALLAEVHRLRALTTVDDDMVERMARALAYLEPGDPWPTNAELGGGPTGTRDDEYRHECMDRARAALDALLQEEA